MTAASPAPSGPPVRIGRTLALTGPLAQTAPLHKIAAEIYVAQLTQGHGLPLGGLPRLDSNLSSRR